jgi:hypothetical protein
MVNFLRCFLVCASFGIAMAANAQSPVYKTIIVTEKQSGDPIPFATLRTTHSSEIFETDFNGKALIPLSESNNDTLFCLFVGYLTAAVPLDSQKNNIFIQIALRREIIRTQGVRISLGINPAHKWLQLAQANRANHNPLEYDDHSALLRTQNLIAVNQIAPDFLNKQLGESLRELSDTLTYVTGDSTQRVLPVFHSETISRVFQQKTPYKQQEIILGSRVHGVGVDQGEFISQVTGAGLLTYNVYKPVLTFLEKGIPSPISDQALANYDYELIEVDKRKALREFVLKVTPKNEQDVAFHGLIWIQEKTGAITRLVLELQGTANLNYIQRVKITQEHGIDSQFQQKWVLKKGRISLDLEKLNNKTASVIALNEIELLSYRLEPHIQDSFTQQRIQKLENAHERDSSFWSKLAILRPNHAYQHIHDQIDSVKALPIVVKGVSLINLMVDGYYGPGLPVEFGPYYMVGGFNPLEGIRTRLGFRTSYLLSEKWQWESFIGYGFRDQRYKYGFKFSWHPNPSTGTFFKLSHSQDVELIGFSDNDAVSSGDALVTALNMFANTSLTYCASEKLELGTDIARGLTLSGIFSHRRYSLPETQRVQLAWYDSLPSNRIGFNLNNATTTLKIRYEPKVFYLIRRGRRKKMSPAGPVYSLSYMQGFKGFLGSNFSYSRLSTQIEQRKVWGSIGRSVWRIQASKVFGTVPYPILDIPLGNQSMVLNNRSFNQMQLFEFVSDQNIQWQFSHHFNGYFFNKIPAISKLKWREVVHTKGIWGTLSPENKALIPQEVHASQNLVPINGFGNIPYMEGGIGIENMFRYFRIDAIWRFSYRDVYPDRNFGIKFSAFVKF